MTQQSFHPLPSNRSFGLLFVVFFGGLSAWMYHKRVPSAQMWGVLSLVVLLVTLFAPKFLTPFNRLWMWVGLMLNRIVSPIVMGVLYFALITPIAFGMRLARRDPLRLSYDRSTSSYWIKREPPGPTQESFHRQF